MLTVMCQACHEIIPDSEAKQIDGMQFCKGCAEVKEKELGGK